MLCAVFIVCCALKIVLHLNSTFSVNISCIFLGVLFSEIRELLVLYSDSDIGLD